VLGLAKLFPGPGGLALVEREERALAAGEARLEVTAAGICGTDLHIAADEMPAADGVILGHEVTGVVIEAAQDVDPSIVGARVVSETFFSTCELCDRCRDGRPNLCADRRSIGMHVDGAFAPRMIVPARNLHRLPDSVPDHVAAMTEPLACVCHCLLNPGVVRPGDKVLITGPGPIGLLAAQVAQDCGAGTVTVAGLPTDDARLEVAQSLGFLTALPDQEFPPVDLAIECSGSAGGATLALTAVRKGGSYVQLGIFGRPQTVPLDHIVVKELTVRTGYATVPSAWRYALELLAARRISPEALVSEVAPLGDWERVFADLRVGRGVKILFDPRLAVPAPPRGAVLQTSYDGGQ
jgi:L-iditol 2-dehydrogenase